MSGSEGVVNKVGMDHLGLLVNGAFNASIAMDDTDGAFQSQWSDQPEVRRARPPASTQDCKCRALTTCEWL